MKTPSDFRSGVIANATDAGMSRREKGGEGEEEGERREEV